jgi:hypothetical protein
LLAVSLASETNFSTLIADDINLLIFLVVYVILATIAIATYAKAQIDQAILCFGISGVTQNKDSLYVSQSSYSCRQVYKDIKPKKRMVALRAAILFLGFAFVLTQSTAAIKEDLETKSLHNCKGKGLVSKPQSQPFTPYQLIKVGAKRRL